MTSEPPALADRRSARFVYGTWAAMTLAGLFFVLRYPHNGPIIDEWEFIPALVNEEPFWPWLWKLHNEHRFPLPRAIYYGLFQLTHDFRTGCLVSLAGISALALGMIVLARQLRGNLHYTDAFFPISLLHWGHVENYLMGYQLCFMLIPLLAGGLLAVVLRTNRSNLFRHGVAAGLLGMLLMLCGAGGLAFGPPVAVWMVLLAIYVVRSDDRGRFLKALGLLLLAAAMCGYVALYFHGYSRPDYHPPSAGVLPSLRIALQALSMAFGPAAIALWPEYEPLKVPVLIVVSAVFAAVAALAAGALVRWVKHVSADWPRAVGLLLYLGAVAALAFGIGWGRSGFQSDRMGLAVRYGWITWPALAALYFLGVSLPRVAAARWLPLGLFAVSLLALPGNMETGRRDGENHLKRTAEWEADVRAGMDGEALIVKHKIEWWPEYLKDRIRVGTRLLREHGISYYRPQGDALDRPAPVQRGSL